MTNFPLNGQGDQHGQVLIVVMWVSLGLVSIALFFCHSMMLEYRAADNSLAGIEAEQAIEGARRYIAFVLENLEESGLMPDGESYESEQVVIGDASFWLLGRSDDQDERDGTPVYGLVDEASKLNLNTATVDMLEALPTMTADLAGAIIDWRDVDSELSPNGAEAQDYLLRDPSYSCKDSEFETVEELRLLIGGDWDLLYGEDVNRNGELDSNENDGDLTYPDDNQDGILDTGIMEYVTVFSREPNTRDDGSERVNIKQDQEEFKSLLQETFGHERAEQIEQTVAPQRTSLESALEYYILSGITQDEFSQIDDALTVSDEDFIEGLVNVNTAGAVVLATLPGIDEEDASQLVAYRESKTIEELNTIAWVTEVLDDESAIEAGPYLTTRTYQYAADIAAVGHLGRGFRRKLFIFDTSGGEPSVIYCRDRSRLGWPLGAETREEYLSRAEQ